jgi:hypothetical protein
VFEDTQLPRCCNGSMPHENSRNGMVATHALTVHSKSSCNGCMIIGGNTAPTRTATIPSGDFFDYAVYAVLSITSLSATGRL